MKEYTIEEEVITHEAMILLFKTWLISATKNVVEEDCSEERDIFLMSRTPERGQLLPQRGKIKRCK